MSFDPTDRSLTGGPLIEMERQDPDTGERFARINANVDVRGTLTQNSQAVGGADVWNYKGATDCSTNPNYPAANAGDVYKVSVAGKIGGASGTVVKVGDIFVCNTDNTLAGTEAQRGTKWDHFPAVSDIPTSTAVLPDSTDKRYVTDAQLTVIGNTSGTNTGDQSVPVKASGAEVDMGTDDAKFVTAKALTDSDYIKEADLPPGGGGITNSAGANVVPKSDGADLVASNISDDGTQILILGGVVSVQAVEATVQVAGSTAIRSNTTTASIGDPDNSANGTKVVVTDSAKTIVQTADTESLAIDGTAHTVALVAVNGVKHSTPAASTAAILANGEISFYLDELTNKLMVAVKYSDGTTKSGEVALI